MILGQSEHSVGNKVSSSTPSRLIYLFATGPLIISVGAALIAYQLSAGQGVTFLVTAMLSIGVGILSAGVCFYIVSRLQEQSKILSQKIAQNSELSDSSHQLKSILQSIQEGIIITGPDGVVTLINKNASQILQREQSTLQNLPLVQVLPMKDLAGKIVKDYQLELTTPTNTKIITKINSFPLISDNKVNGTIYIVTDITDESELAKMKLDFVAQAAHQLRTPLTILKSYLSVLQEKLGPRLAGEDKLYMDRSVIGANQLSDLIENLLNVSKIEQNKLELQLTPTQIDRLIFQVVGQLYTDANSKKVSLSYQPSPLPPVLVDQRLIGQVLTNLIKNAIEYSSEGGSVVVTAIVQGVEIAVTVADNGVGIPSEATANLFTKFYKVSGGDLRQESKGIGLGLYNAKSIIEAHHGKIWVNSILNKGSSFGFTLPLMNSAPV